MKIISHRGNLDGAVWQRENTMLYILEALARGFDVEIDVWLSNGVLRLGHDGPMEIARDTMHPIMVEQDYLDEKFSIYEEELYKKVVGRDVVRNKTACCGAYFAAFRKSA
jgi:glycerophosphoryl diester phosphodiesterase